MRFKDGATEFGWRGIGVAIAEPSNCITFQFVRSSHRVLVNGGVVGCPATVWKAVSGAVCGIVMGAIWGAILADDWDP